jgi:hypothetical protein
MGTKSGSGQQNAGEDASLVQQPDPNTITTKAGTFSVTGDNDPEYQAFLQGAGKTENLAYAQWKAKYKN